MGARRGGGRLVLAGLLIGLAVACSSGDDDTADGDGGDAATEEATTDADAATTDADAATEPVELPAGYEGYVSETYADDAHWLCKPGIADDVCSRDLDVTLVEADGTTEVVEHVPADDPAVDCFYVYPTTSRDAGTNSDLVPAEGEEIVTVLNQAARLTSTCRVFAPVYRQITLSAIGGGGARPDDGSDPRALAYGDVVDAFKDYVVNESDGRGFVLLGHSQGAGMITRLIQDEIDDEPLLRDRLVAAYVLGSSLQVPEGEVVGGDFASVPLCEADDQTGCVVSYSSYRSAKPPVEGSLFGRGGEGTQAACVNPAALGGGAASLQAIFYLTPPEGTLLGGTRAVAPFTDPARSAEVTTPWVEYPDFVQGECVSEGGYSYLALTVEGDPADPRTDDIGGDLNDQWGMHLVDANVAMGDIVDLVEAQGAAYAG